MSVRTGVVLLIVVFALLSTGTSAHPRRVQQNEAPREPAPVNIICSANGTRCWSEGSLVHSDGRCYPALARGPCPDGQWWLLERNGSAASARGKCAELACPPDARSAACRRRMQRAAEACPRRPDGDAQFAVHLDPTGRFRCGEFPGRVEALRAQIVCLSLPDIAGAGQMRPSFIVHTNGRNCAQNDRGHCEELVENSQPNIALEPED